MCTDPDFQQCYLGDKAAYERYQQLAIQNSISADQRNVREHRWDPQALQMWVNSHGGVDGFYRKFHAVPHLPPCLTCARPVMIKEVRFLAFPGSGPI